MNQPIIHQTFTAERKFIDTTGLLRHHAPLHLRLETDTEF